MFDLAGLAAIDGRALSSARPMDSAFTVEPWVSHRHTRLNIDAPDCRAIGLKRESDPEDYAELEGCRLFLVGDVFARMHRTELSRGRIPASALLAAYRAHGAALQDGIKGNFTLLIADMPAQKFHIISSHFAVSPLYYAYTGGIVYFATGLAEIGALMPTKPEVDLASVVKTALLNWPLHERTFLRGVRRISSGAIVTLSPDGMRKQVYWDQRPLYRADLLSRAEALEHGSELFHHCANAMVADRDRICVSFTSGFDSRALHAVLEKDHSQILSYSFGIPGSINLSIPQTICARFNYPFQAFPLGKQYEDVFAQYARQTVRLSDGVVAQRANYPYAFERLGEHAPVVVTGIFGSEFLRTFQNLGEFVSENFVRLNAAADPIAVLRELTVAQQADSYLTPETFAAAQAEVEADVAEWFEWTSGYDTNQRLHLYLLGEASRRYFGAEVGTERVYATNLFPFLDIDFFEFIFRAPFAGVHSRAVKPTISDRFNSQYFYAYLIRKYRPELLPYTTDHGYPPADLLKTPPLLYAGPGYLRSRVAARITRFREFTPEEWLPQFYRDHLFAPGDKPYPFLAPKFRQDFESGAWQANLSAFEKTAALRLWLQEWY